MKIYSVIVDELPEDCWECPFSCLSMYDFECDVIDLAMGKNIPPEAADQGFRPDWCPLVKEAESEG